MQTKLQPHYEKLDVKCSCGNAFAVFSTLDKSSLHIEICSECHPFYTGKHKIVDTAGRVDKFNKKFSSRIGVDKKK